MYETISAKLPPALKTIGIRTKHHNFPVPVFENEPGKFNIFFPDSGTKLLLPKIWSQIPGKTKKLSISFSFILSLLDCFFLSFFSGLKFLVLTGKFDIF